MPIPGASKDRSRINVLPGCYLTPGDLDELRDILEAFGLTPTFLPDLSGSLDGHIPKDFTPTTIGGVGVDEIAQMGTAAWTLAIGEQMRPAAEALTAKTGTPFKLFDRITGLLPCDNLMMFLSGISGREVPVKYRRQRGQLVDAMLDGHFHIGGRRVAMGAEPDLLYAATQTLHEMGAIITAAVTTTQSPINEKIASEEVLIGDLEDLEIRAKDCELLITHAHGRQAAERLNIPFYRLGMPIFDRLGAAHQTIVGYRGTRTLIFEIANLMLANGHEPNSETWRDMMSSKAALPLPLTQH